MADRLQWVLDLQDRLSGPAARIERQLGQVKAQLRALDITAKQNKLSSITDPLKRQRAELQLQRDKLLLSKSALDKAGDASKKAGGDAGFFTRQLHDVLHIAQIVGGALERVGNIALGVGQSIAKAVSFRQGSMIGLEAILGSDASGTFERLAALAGRIGKPIEQVVNLGRTLANVGVKSGDLEPMVRFIEDLDALDPGAGDKLAGVVRGIFSTGKMTSGDVEALRGTILKPEKIYEDIAQRFGAGRNRIAGKAILDTEIGVGKNIGVQTLLSQVLGLEGGRAGSASARGGLTLESRIARVGTQIERMFSRLGSSRGIKAFSSVLDNLIDLFNPDSKTGRRTLDTLNKLSDVFARVLGPLTTKDGREKMEGFFNSLITLGSRTVEIFGKVAGYVGTIVAGADAVNKAFPADSTARNGKATGVAAQFAKQMPGPFEAARDFFAGRGAPINVTVNVTANGTSKDDANRIADEAKRGAIDALTDALDQRATQRGGQ